MSDGTIIPKLRSYKTFQHKRKWNEVSKLFFRILIYCKLLFIPNVKCLWLPNVKLPSIFSMNEEFTSLNRIYNQFSASVAGIRLANGVFVSVFGAFVASSLTEFTRLDKESDEMEYLKDSILQPSTFDFIIGKFFEKNTTFHRCMGQSLISEALTDNLHATVGAGAAGSIVAGKLASKFKVLLLEAGGEPHPLQSIPGLALGMLTQPSIDWRTLTVPQVNACLAHNNQVISPSKTAIFNFVSGNSLKVVSY